ncbi:hypothetical protein C882_2802 [Caenispirillum salinarum AK4]|uniref:DUF2202 domain-containing protein n=1 Tax=Caenispirillum salinarum AK4 TaxID=1238182 RepID=K9GMP0_9PROT|nr:hypothetical protein [Caenispirillum salinarum]EKV26367.1 hypothetical protein C882_2802 [Caenispirillum salinarum AK4]
MMRVADAMAEALDDEYKAIATYESVLAAFGPVRPFVNIVEAERRHAGALLRLYERRGLTPPRDRWSGSVPAPASVKDACAAGVTAEVENAALYDRLLAAVSGDAEVARVFTNLRDASQQRHLPAFRRCLEGGGGPDAGPVRRGHGRRQGRRNGRGGTCLAH